MPESPRIEELKRRVQVDPASIAFAALAEEYRRAGRFEEAIATCQAGLQRHPAYLSARVTLGRALLELKRFDEAREELTHVLRSAPENLAAIRGLAEIHHRRGELPEALEQYRTALNVAKHDAEIEQAVQEISKRVGAGDDASNTQQTGLTSAIPVASSPEAPAPAVDSPAEPKRPIPLSRPRLELVTWSPAPAQPKPEPDAAPDLAAPAEGAVAEEPPSSLAAAFDLLVPPASESIERRAADEPEAAIEAGPAEPAFDPALSALEGFLAAILREKDALAAHPSSRR